MVSERTRGTRLRGGGDVVLDQRHRHARRQGGEGSLGTLAGDDDLELSIVQIAGLDVDSDKCRLGLAVSDHALKLCQRARQVDRRLGQQGIAVHHQCRSVGAATIVVEPLVGLVEVGGEVVVVISAVVLPQDDVAELRLIHCLVQPACYAWAVGAALGGELLDQHVADKHVVDNQERGLSRVVVHVDVLSLGQVLQCHRHVDRLVGHGGDHLGLDNKVDLLHLVVGDGAVDVDHDRLLIALKAADSLVAADSGQSHVAHGGRHLDLTRLEREILAGLHTLQRQVVLGQVVAIDIGLDAEHTAVAAVSPLAVAILYKQSVGLGIHQDGQRHGGALLIERIAHVESLGVLRNLIGGVERELVPSLVQGGSS